MMQSPTPDTPTTSLPPVEPMEVGFFISLPTGLQVVSAAEVLVSQYPVYKRGPQITRVTVPVSSGGRNKLPQPRVA